MNVMGIGLMEFAVIFLVAFLVLGPGRTIGMARTAGKLLGDMKRTFSEVAAAASLEQREQEADRLGSVPQEQEKEETPSKTGDE